MKIGMREKYVLVRASYAGANQAARSGVEEGRYRRQFHSSASSGAAGKDSDRPGRIFQADFHQQEEDLNDLLTRILLWKFLNGKNG